MKSKRLLLSALKPSEFRDIWRLYNGKEVNKNAIPNQWSEDELRTDAKNAYNNLFNGKQRIYIDIEEDGSYNYNRANFEKFRAEYCNYMNPTLAQFVCTYLLSTNKINIEDLGDLIKVQDILREWDFSYATPTWKIAETLWETKSFMQNKRRNIKIGTMYSNIKKYLSKHPDFEEIASKTPSRKLVFLNIDTLETEYHKILEYLSQAITETIEDTYEVVISRHPYDIAGMSTDRNWSSCVDLRGGSNRHYIISSIMSAHLVAYLIKKADKNINRPLARMLLKPYVLDGEEMNFDPDNPNWWLETSQIYYDGSDIARATKEMFRKTVKKWVNQNWNRKYGRRKSTYNISKYSYQEFDEDDDIIETL